MTIINFKGTIIISVILVHINFAQTTNDTTSIKIDTAKLKSTNKFVEKQSLRLYELKILYNNLFNKPPFNTSGNNVIYSEPYASSNYGYGVSDYRITDRLKLFNVSFRKLLAKDYEKRGRYDLGEFGKYLGIAKKIIVIALWLLSF